jgi:hypothetical protein
MIRLILSSAFSNMPMLPMMNYVSVKDGGEMKGLRTLILECWCVV